MEVAILISAVSAVADVIQLWYKFKDRRKVMENYEEKITQPIKAEFIKEAQVLQNLIPQDLLDVMNQRIQNCLTRYKKVMLSDIDYLPIEMDNATEAVRKCVCRELNRILKVNGFIPKGELSRFWDTYKCPTIILEKGLENSIDA